MYMPYTSNYSLYIPYAIIKPRRYIELYYILDEDGCWYANKLRL